MPCHPDRVRRNYEAGRAAAAAASWQRPSDIAAEQLQRRCAPELAAGQHPFRASAHVPVSCATCGQERRFHGIGTGVTANVIEGEEHDPIEPDEDCLWGV